MARDEAEEEGGAADDDEEGRAPPPGTEDPFVDEEETLHHLRHLPRDTVANMPTVTVPSPGAESSLDGEDDGNPNRHDTEATAGGAAGSFPSCVNAIRGGTSKPSTEFPFPAFEARCDRSNSAIVWSSSPPTAIR